MEAPRQRLTREEKRQIRDGEPPYPGRRKARQKDTQARVVEGLLILAFGYKSHIAIDCRFGLIRRFIVTGAARHDGAQLPGRLNPDAFDSRVWADSAYRSKANEAAIAAAGRRSMVHFHKPKGRPMPEPHQRANRARSAVRSAVEHVFADRKVRMALFIRTIGLGRATVKIGLATLAYNFRRLIGLRGELRPDSGKTAAYFRLFSQNPQFSPPKERRLPVRAALSSASTRAQEQSIEVFG